MSHHLRLYDSNQYHGLYLIHYDCKVDKNCLTEVDKKVTGYILNKEEIICRNLPTAEECSCEDKIKNIKEFRFFDSIEGTNIRVFYYNDSWFISTTKRISAFTSFWGDSDKSFGKLFSEAIRMKLWTWVRKLNKNYQYIFRITPTLNTRRISKYSKIPNVYHVATFIGGDRISFDENVEGIPKLNEYFFESVEELREFVRKSNPLEREGIIAVEKGNNVNNKFIKIVSDKYLTLNELRGNVCDINLRYLQIRNSIPQRIFFTNLYKERIKQFERLEICLVKLTKIIHKKYMDTNVNKGRKIDLDINTQNFLKSILRKCHRRYKKTGEKTTKSVVYDFVSKVNPKYLLTIFNSLNLICYSKITPLFKV